MCALGWQSGETELMFTYDSKRQTLSPRPMRATSVAGRITTLLERYLELTEEDLKQYGSHSMRRGGATYYNSIGLPTGEL